MLVPTSSSVRWYGFVYAYVYSDAIWPTVFILMCLCADEVALETVTEEGGRYVLVVLPLYWVVS